MVLGRQANPTSFRETVLFIPHGSPAGGSTSLPGAGPWPVNNARLRSRAAAIQTAKAGLSLPKGERHEIGTVVGVALLLSGISATAAEGHRCYNVSATVSVDGKEVMHPHAIVEADHPARIEVGDTSANSYRVDFTVPPGEGNHANGQAKVEVNLFTKVMGNWTLRSQPSLVVWTGQSDCGSSGSP